VGYVVEVDHLLLYFEWRCTEVPYHDGAILTCCQYMVSAPLNDTIHFVCVRVELSIQGVIIMAIEDLNFWVARESNQEAIVANEYDLDHVVPRSHLEWRYLYTTSLNEVDNWLVANSFSVLYSLLLRDSWGLR
jgi:hypothetical protein